MPGMIRMFIGLPGSGKTSMMAALGDDWEICDDPMSPSDMPDVLSRNNLAIGSPAFCVPEVADQAEDILRERFPDMMFERTYFMNDPLACLSNASRRPGKSVDAFIRSLTRRYEPPENAIPVWAPDVSAPSSAP